MLRSTSISIALFSMLALAACGSSTTDTDAGATDAHVAADVGPGETDSGSEGTDAATGSDAHVALDSGSAGEDAATTGGDSGSAGEDAATTGGDAGADSAVGLDAAACADYGTCV